MVRIVLIPIAAALIALAAPLFLSGCGAQGEALLERLRQHMCIRNQKQIVAAARMYAQDWEGVLPDVGRYTDTNGWFYGNRWEDGPDWSASDSPIRDYLNGGDEVFVCPNVADQPSPSYAWNRHLSGFPKDFVQYPATCPLVWDWVPGESTAPGIPLDPICDCAFWGWYPVGGDEAARCAMAKACSRHQRQREYGRPDGLILAFVDGHASFEWPTRWRVNNTAGRFMDSADYARPWPPPDYSGSVISMYPRDPMRNPAP